MKHTLHTGFNSPSPLYRWDQEHDSCGVGFVANVHGKKSYEVVDRAVTCLKTLAHRGAIDADAVTGDGAGILTQIPYELFRDYLEQKGKHLHRDQDLGVGMVFVPRQEEYEQVHAKHIIKEAIKAEGLSFLAWREVPVNPGCLGKKAELTRPLILQAFFARDEDLDDEEFERRCFLAMKGAERRAESEKVSIYIVSFSSRTITYKGLLNAPQIRRFFLDLRSPKFKSSFAIFHQRFATNTLPDWEKAQPFRMSAHNGEINTIRGNRNLMRAREFSKRHGSWGDRYKDTHPIIQYGMSDSASLDNTLQLITVAGRSCVQAVSMLMPTAWENDSDMTSQTRDFYRYHSMVMEPWDGPAGLVFTDGRFVAAALDRNGLRPLRYKLYADGTFVIASEIGLIRQFGSPVKKCGRLGSGKMIAIDLKNHCLLYDIDIKSFMAARADYSGWCRNSLHNLHRLADKNKRTESQTVSDDKIETYQAAFNYNLEECETIILPMATQAVEPTGSMGDDTPLAVLSRRPRLLYSYFKQLFAQVTNPAIDSLRETLVMSLNMYLGGRVELFDDIDSSEDYLELNTPLLLERDFDQIFKTDFLKGRTLKLEALFEVDEHGATLEEAVKGLARKAREAARKDDLKLIVLSDRGISPQKAAIPMLLAVGAVHQELIKVGRRLRVDIIAETGEARDVHQIACLLGFGANAVYPYLVLDIIRHLAAQGQLAEGLNAEKAVDNYRTAIDMGLRKIMSKMGISTLLSYQGAQIFEAIGLGDKLVEECFYGTPSPIGGICYRQIAWESLRRHQRAFLSEGPIELHSDGYYMPIKKANGVFHGWNPKVVSGMNRFLRKNDDPEAYENFKTASDEHTPSGIKDLLKFRYAKTPLPIEEVEPAGDICARFTTAGMSLGALSPEAHECLAIAMNRIGGKSNTGEGGEDPIRFHPLENGDNANSAIKQIASGRFGVTAEYLANAREIEIKIAQGSKPGEGGQLPGHKVTDYIARLRFSTPGITLISPPPHHDIYSIEDLAQLIFDLKEVNPRAKVCVKLVACSGVGTIAAGVTKAYADVILISGHDGGTGASPLSSIKNAGSAWEIGLAEAHQVLMMNGLRNRVTLRTDGGMKTGRDIVIAALLGAEEYNFGTAALIAAGCAMFRVCHLNTCPTGVATQREDLRAKFRGKPENVINYFNAVAEDVRRTIARLGCRTMDEIIGRTDLLEQIEDPGNPKSRMINLDGLLHNPDPSGEMDRIHTRARNDSPGHEGSLDHLILQDARETITRRKHPFHGIYKVNNTHRDIGVRLSGEIAYLHGNTGMPPGMLDLTFIGSAGQSFGAFLVQGIHMKLQGEANDYVGKGMHSGEIIIHPRDNESFIWHENIIIGNTCLYGATGGYFFAAGCAGERFAVRNSGATAVIEGVGDHGCEYMTSGTVVVLGATGRNFGSGMSGGLAFVYDEKEEFEHRYNSAMVGIERLEQSDEIESLHRLIDRHHEFTASPRARELLDQWEAAIARFWKVVPHPPTPDFPKSFFKFSAAMQTSAV